MRARLLPLVPLLAAAVTVVVAPRADAASTVPGAVRSLTAKGGVGTVTATWLKPSGTPAADGYDVVGAGCGLDGTRHRQTATSVTFTGLADHCLTTVVVYAHGSKGDGPASVTTATTTDAPTGAVRDLTAVVIDGAMRLRWQPPALSGQSAPTGYVVTASIGTQVVTSYRVVLPGTDLPGLPPRSIVTFVITPVNLAGLGTPNVVSAVPGITFAKDGPTRIIQRGSEHVKLQVRATATFTGAPLGNDLVNVYAQHGSVLTQVAHLRTNAAGVATYTAHVLSPAAIVLRPASRSVQGVLFHITPR